MEDQATKVSVEEQMQLTTIQTLQNDLNSGSSSHLYSFFSLLNRLKFCLFPLYVHFLLIFAFMRLCVLLLLEC